ncbi:MAG: hypothetical protein IT324_11140 [Anaerolineae bacterium]|nr:hypothetical protein [Anaerolineae bacterium]
MLTSRERVLCALNHEEPDRVPIFLGTSGVTTLLAQAYDHLKAHLGIQRETKLISNIYQYALLDEDILQRFHSDGRPLLPGPAPSPLSRVISEDTFIDGWGVRFYRSPNSLYYDPVEAPLRNATIDDLERYPWPDLAHPSRFVGLREQAKAIQEAGCAVVVLSGISPFEHIELLRGMDNWLFDLAGNPEFADALFRKVCYLMKASGIALMEAAGDYIDVLVMGDDLGSQTAPLIAPKMYRKMIKPYHADLIAAIKSRGKTKIFFHSDGNIYKLLGDLIEIGVDIINPVQVSAGEMGDTARLKREFGDRLSFNGAIDTRWVLPRGTPSDVQQEVRRRINDLAPGGGYILSAVHCIQPDVPLDNLFALFDEAVTAGRYPLALS